MWAVTVRYDGCPEPGQRPFESVDDDGAQVASMVVCGPDGHTDVSVAAEGATEDEAQGAALRVADRLAKSLGLPQPATEVSVKPLLDDYARELVASWPPLSETQRAKLAVLLRP